MKNEILDDIFNDDLRNQLEPNEKVVWDGNPSITPFTKWSTILGVIILILFLANILFKGWDFSSAIYFIIMVPITLLNLLKSKKIRYVVTDQRIIFQLWKKWKRQFHSIPLEDIKKILLTDEDSKSGTILLLMKNGKRKPFKTYDLKNNHERPHVSLEMIENVEEVAEYIEMERQKKLLP